MTAHSGFLYHEVQPQSHRKLLLKGSQMRVQLLQPHRHASRAPWRFLYLVEEVSLVITYGRQRPSSLRFAPMGIYRPAVNQRACHVHRKDMHVLPSLSRIQPTAPQTPASVHVRCVCLVRPAYRPGKTQCVDLEQLRRVLGGHGRTYAGPTPHSWIGLIRIS